VKNTIENSAIIEIAKSTKWKLLCKFGDSSKGGITGKILSDSHNFQLIPLDKSQKKAVIFIKIFSFE
jgi:hypothetical protein